MSEQVDKYQVLTVEFEDGRSIQYIGPVISNKDEELIVKAIKLSEPKELPNNFKLESMKNILNEKEEEKNE